MKVDREKLGDIVHQAAADDLKTLAASSLKLYAIDVEDSFKSEFRKVMKARYAEVKDTLTPDQRFKFLDLENGYLAQMINWIDANPMKIPSVPCLIETAEPESKDITDLRSFVKSREALFIGGATICLLVSGFKLWAFVAEALAIAWGVYKYNDAKNTKEKLDAERARALEICINEYISEVKDAAFQWIEQGEAYSEQLINRF